MGAFSLSPQTNEKQEENKATSLEREFIADMN